PRGGEGVRRTGQGPSNLRQFGFIIVPSPRTNYRHPMKFIDKDFLLSTRTARRLYHQFAEPEPIFDYHCHLPPQDIAANRRFNNLFEIWLEGDHYKWRAMRANGVAEQFC